MITQESYYDYPQVIRSSKDGLLYVNYGEMVPELLEAINELNNKIKRLEKELAQSRKEIRAC